MSQKNKNVVIAKNEPINDEAETFIFGGLKLFSKERGFLPYDHRAVSVLARDSAAQCLLGGLTGWTARKCMEIGTLFVGQDKRGEGIGSQLVRAAEEIAKERGCVAVTVNTMLYQAPNFYEKMGYALQYEVDLHEAGKRRTYLKVLTP